MERDFTATRVNELWGADITWVLFGENLPWAANQGVSKHWIRQHADAG